MSEGKRPLNPPRGFQEEERRRKRRHAPTPWETMRRGSEEFLTRQGGVLRTKEAKEDWEERKGKKTTPEGSKFLTFSPFPPFVNDNNELCERKQKLSSLLLLM